MNDIMGLRVLKISIVTMLCLIGMVPFCSAQQATKQGIVAEPQPANSQIEKVAESKHSVVPADFPVFKATGNNEKDKADYADRKAKWIADNPERYAKLTNDTE